MHSQSIVIVGGGHAGAQLCAALVALGQGACVHLVCEEDEVPYQRPPLSKSFIKSPDEALQTLRSAQWYSSAGITVHRADPAVAIDRTNQVLQLRSGALLEYAHLVLATGVRARRLLHLPEGLGNVAVLRTAADALSVRALLDGPGSFTVVGGGFIGLEVAATACALGKRVQVFESAPRLLMRSVSPELAQHVLQVHRNNGMDVRVGVAVGGFECVWGQLAALEVDGERHPVDALLLGIGAVPEHGLASDAGLVCENGIVVDEYMRTSDPAILAIGDCVCFPEPTTGKRLRLESVQNANDQARTAAATLTGQPQAHGAAPWFWSEQGGMRLQIAGLMPPDSVRHLRHGTVAGSFSVLHYAQAGLTCVESVNAPGDHIAARKLLEGRNSPEPALACDPARPLKSFL